MRLDPTECEIGDYIKIDPINSSMGWYTEKPILIIGKFLTDNHKDKPCYIVDHQFVWMIDNNDYRTKEISAYKVFQDEECKRLTLIRKRKEKMRQIWGQQKI